MLYSTNLDVAGTIDNRGGGNTANGGTLKIFCGAGTKTINLAALQSTTGRLFQGGSCATLAAVNKPYWTNTQNGVNPLANAEAGDTVLMKVSGVNLGSINYSIYKGPLLWFDRIQAAQSPALGYSNWVAGKKADGTSSTGAFYFLATVFGITNTSDNLNVNPATSTSDSMPVAKIDYPNAADYRFAAGSAVAFNQSSYDADDLLNITWNFGDGNTTIAAIEYSNATSPAAGNTLHNYTAGGKWYTISLTAQEMARSQSAVDSRDIYIFKEGINVIPVISLPLNSGAYANGIVPFNASQSYVLNCSSLACPSGKTCLAQSQTGNLYCFYLHAPNTRTTSGYNLEANWTIGGQSPVYGNWSNYSQFVEFSKFYAQSGIFTAKVKLKYSSGSVIEEAESPLAEFSAGAGWICTSNTTSAFWTKTGQASINATTNCTLYSSAYYPSCCPGNCFPCESNGRCNCSSGIAAISACNDYKTQASCNTAPVSIAKATLLLALIAGKCGQT